MIKKVMASNVRLGDIILFKNSYHKVEELVYSSSKVQIHFNYPKSLVCNYSDLVEIKARTDKEILLRILESLKNTKNNDIKVASTIWLSFEERRAYYDYGFYQGRINLCEDLIRFINDNLEKGNK